MVRQIIFFFFLSSSGSTNATGYSVSSIVFTARTRCSATPKPTSVTWCFWAWCRPARPYRTTTAARITTTFATPPSDSVETAILVMIIFTFFFLRALTHNYYACECVCGAVLMLGDIFFLFTISHSWMNFSKNFSINTTAKQYV